MYFPNIQIKRGFRKAETTQVPENREDSCHLANCTNFVSDYFFPCCSCTYFQWNKRESQAHRYLQSHHFTAYQIQYNCLNSVLFTGGQHPNTYKTLHYKILASEYHQNHHHPPCPQNTHKKSLGCSQWFAKASKHLNYCHYNRVTIIIHLPNFMHEIIHWHLCLLRRSYVAQYRSQILKPQKKHQLLILTQLSMRKQFLICWFLSQLPKTYTCTN